MELRRGVSACLDAPFGLGDPAFRTFGDAYQGGQHDIHQCRRGSGRYFRSHPVRRSACRIRGGAFPRPCGPGASRTELRACGHGRPHGWRHAGAHDRHLPDSRDYRGLRASPAPHPVCCHFLRSKPHLGEVFHLYKATCTERRAPHPLQRPGCPDSAQAGRHSFRQIPARLH